MDESIKTLLIRALENAGIYISPDANDDVNLTNFIEDSVHFVSVVVNIEAVFEIEIPEELLVFDTYQSLNGMIEVLKIHKCK